MTLFMHILFHSTTSRFRTCTLGGHTADWEKISEGVEPCKLSQPYLCNN